MAEECNELRTVLEGNSEFAKKLYKILAEKSGNVFFSPISIHAILSLVYQGSKGDTQKAFGRTLNLPDVGVAAEGYKDVMTRLNLVKDVVLLIANKVFLRESYQLQKSFKNVAVQQFFSEVEQLNFDQVQEAASSINTWVEKKTENKIKDVITEEDITEDTALILVNAIYFKGNWLLPFKVKRTRTELFYLNDNDTVDVQMMHNMERFYYKYDEELDAQVLELPYTNRNISLIIVLPRKRNGITELEQKLAGIDITKITQNMYIPRDEVIVSFPKFKIEQTIDLKAPLTELGLGVIFDRSSADLSGTINTSKPLYVSKVIQKAFIDVNEIGTEAAAATVYRYRTLCRKYPEEFRANHPFVIILQSKYEDTTNILFKGRISEPKY